MASVASQPVTPVASSTVPLCVDLDGTLSRSDTLHESLLLLLKLAPGEALKVPAWLAKGKAYFKEQVSLRAQLNPQLLPFNEELLTWLRAEREQGRRMVLVTAAHRDIARAVADHLGLFDDIMATEHANNLSGDRKRAALVERFGERGFDYVGNDKPDLKVWSAAREAILVNAGSAIERRARQVSTVSRVLKDDRNTAKEWMRALRFHQWVKNSLVFLPLLLAHQATNLSMFWLAAQACIAFCLCASSVYILNDLLDLQSDRRHPRKRLRPFAAGALPASQGIVAAFLLLFGAFGLAAVVGWIFAAALGLYYVGTALYSLLFKRGSLVDVMLLSGLYTMRILGGAAAIMIAPSFWLLAFSVFLFLSLAVVKRFAELDMMVRQGRTFAAGRAYEAEDLPVLLGFGTASGYCSVLVLALYINSNQSQALYSRPEVLWLVCPLLLYWISRVWLLTHRGKMHDDPIVFALKDKISLVVGAMVGVIAVCAL